MSMEPLGGSMPAGQPIALAAGNRTHVFGIGTGGVMNHWTSADGGPWTGPTPLPGGNLEPSFLCAITPADGSVHVFAIVHGGPLCHWRSTDGFTWTFQLDGRAAVPGVGNGVAAVSWGGSRVDAFATTPAGIVQYSFDGTTALPPGPMLPASGGLNRCVLGAASAAPNTIDLFAVDPNVGMPLRWHFDGATWSRSMLPGPALHIANNNNNQNLNSFAAPRNPGSPTIDLFAITVDMRVTHWSVNGGGNTFEQLPVSPWPLAEGVVAAVPTPIGLDVFAIGRGDVFHGGPLVRWHFDGSWHGPVAYESGLAAGGVGAVFGAGGLEAFGIQSGASNPLLHWPAGIAGAQHDGWVNWAGTQRIDHPEGHCYPTSLEELVEIVKTAAQQGKRVRAVGSSWSFSDIAVTPGYIVETNRMNQVLTHVIPKAQSPNAVSILQRRRKRGQPPPPPVPFHLVHVEAGLKLEDLMGILDGMGMGPGTMGGSAGQTVAGVVSTSVHGSHYKLPPVPDWVRAIHLVGPDGRQYWIEPQNRPVTDPAKLAAALGPMVTIKYDNDWFDSVLVSVGSLGIIYSLILEVRDAYKLEATRKRFPWSALRPQLSVGNASNLFQDGDGVQLAIDPGTLANPDPVCIRETRRTVPMATPSSGAAGFDALAAFCEGDGLLDLLFQSAAAAGVTGPVLASLMPAVLAMEAALAPAIVPLIAPLLPVLAAATTVAAATPALLAIIRVAGPGALGDVIGHVLDGHPELIAPVTSGLTQMMQPEGVTVDLAHNIMAPRNKGECAARGLALEIAIDTAADAHLAFADAAIALLRSEATKGNYLGGWFSLRFVGTSRAILSPEHSAMTCTAEFTGLRTLSDTRALLDKLEALARDKGATQHWAMCNDLRASDVARGYPRLDTWRRVRWALTNGARVRTFDNEFTGRCGLHELHTDLALTGGTGWATIPVASSGQDGTFVVTNQPAANFASWADGTNVTVHVGDFNDDGRGDLALTGGNGWRTIPVAFSNGGGSFTVTNLDAPDFAGWAQAPNVRVHVGDFNGDGRADLALTGGPGWATIPLALSNGDGSFTITNQNASDFPGWAQSPNVNVVVGDFNGDGRTDLALTGVTGWATIPVALSNGDGSFTITNQNASDFPGWAQSANVKVVVGDFNGDGRADLALTGVTGWATIPVALSNGDGSFTITNRNASDFPGWAQSPNVKVVVGDFDGDGRTDLALTGVTGWATIPVALSNGDGSFTITNQNAPDFAAWAQGMNVAVHALSR